MVNRTSFEDVSNGDYLYEGFFTDLKDKSLVRQFASSEDTTEYSETLSISNWTDLGYSKTFTVPSSIGSNNIIFGLKIIMSAKYANFQSIIRATLTNNTTGQATSIYNLHRSIQPAGSSVNDGYIYYNDSTSYVEETKYLIFPGRSSSGIGLIHDALFGGATYTLTFEARRGENEATTVAYIKNITVTALVVHVDDVETTGWA